MNKLYITLLFSCFIFASMAQECFLTSDKAIMKPVSYDCGVNSSTTNPGWVLFYQPDAGVDCNANLIQSTTFSLYPDILTTDEVTALQQSIVWQSGTTGTNPTGQTSFCYTQPITLNNLGTYRVSVTAQRSAANTTVITSNSVDVLVKLAKASLADAHCCGSDCCLLAMDCLSNIRNRMSKSGPAIASPFTTKTEAASFDDLCPFPRCAHGYQYDDRLSVNSMGQLVTVSQFVWTPQPIPLIQPHERDCILRSPDPSDQLRLVDCSNLSGEFCKIPKRTNSNNTSGQFDTFRCSELHLMNCSYVAGIDGHVRETSCARVYITFPLTNNTLDFHKRDEKVARNAVPQPTGSVGACVRYVEPPVGPSWIYHVPYTSMMHCLADQPRSTGKWCTKLFQDSYYKCKQSAGLATGG